MTLPKTLNIFGVKFKIKLATLDGYLGMCDRRTNIIWIEKNQTDKEKLHTLIHEVGHAVYGRVGLTQAVSPEVEEILVESFATALIENKLISVG